jgi:serine/threonine protein kinase
MKDSNYYSHECEILSKNIKEYYKQNLCYPNTDLSFYKYGRVIGRGAFGKVNIGLNILTGRIVAIKSFNKKNLVNESAKNKILYETNLMRGLWHPSVTKILETFECENYMLIIMEYISGGNLQNFVKKRRKLCEKTAKILFRQIIQGIRYIHSRGIVHRDIKLENILLDLNNIIKICDFGVGKLIKPNTILKDQCGTPVYMAPEILKGNGYKGFPVDIWSAGVALYIMLSGTLPFNKDKEHDLEYAILNNNIKEIKDISEEGNNLLKNILEKDPNKRFTCNQILEHPWLNNNLNDEEYIDLDYNNEIKNVNKYHLFTNAESILLAKTHIDYRNAQKKDLAENFTIKNLYTLDEKNKKNVDTKSAILAPYNSMLSEEDNDNMNSSKSKGSLCDNLDNFNNELEIKNGIIKFHGKVKEFNMNYELNNNGEIDNGMLINSKNDLVSIEDDDANDDLNNEKNIYLVKNNNNTNKNKIPQNKKHRPSSPYRPPPINKVFVKMVSDLGYNEEYVIKCLEKKELNHATTVYYLFSNYENVK